MLLGFPGFCTMIVGIYVDRFGELLGWSDADCRRRHHVCTVREYKTALLKARRRNPKRPRDAFLPLDKHEYIQLDEGIFVVNENLELLNGTPRTSETIRRYLADSAR
ncbi:hypothetical protein LC607_18040 [Nostoc sp. CHAB 5824]|nr:hypothetical protein [Nostoc sp. CHAB 5824]